MNAEYKNYKLSSMFSVFSVLLPAHPSIQEPLSSYGVPSIFISIAFFVMAIVSFGRLTITRKFLFTTMYYMSFCAFVTVGLLRSNVILEAAGLQVFITIFVITPMVLVCAYMASYNAKFSVYAVLVSSLITALHVLYKIYTTEQVAGFIALNTDLKNPNYQATAFYVGLLTVIVCGLMLSSKNIKLILYFSIFVGLCLLMSVVGARSVFVALIIVLLTNLFFKSKFNFLLLFIVLSLVYLTFHRFLIQLSENILLMQRFAALGEDDSSSRVFLFSSAIDLWLLDVKTFLFGSGIGYFPIYINADGPGWYPHNFILEILAELGVVALMPIVFLLFMAFSNGNIIYRVSPIYEIHVFSFFLYCFISYQFMGGLNSIWLPMFFMFLVIFCCSRTEGKVE